MYYPRLFRCSNVLKDCFDTVDSILLCPLRYPYLHNTARKFLKDTHMIFPHHVFYFPRSVYGSQNARPLWVIPYFIVCKNQKLFLRDIVNMLFSNISNGQLLHDSWHTIFHAPLFNCFLRSKCKLFYFPLSIVFVYLLEHCMSPFERSDGIFHKSTP